MIVWLIVTTVPLKIFMLFCAHCVLRCVFSTFRINIPTIKTEIISINRLVVELASKSLKQTRKKISEKCFW